MTCGSRRRSACPSTGELWEKNSHHKSASAPTLSAMSHDSSRRSVGRHPR